MTIDWNRIEGRAPAPKKFTPAQIKAAVAAVNALPADGDDPNKVAAFWDCADDLPDISQIDFGDATRAQANLATILASTKRLNRTKLLWHVKHPGQAMRKNPFTTEPMVCTTDDGTVIIVDGHHRLGAQLMLGAKSFPVWNVPVTS